MTIVESDGPPSWSLDASETGESTKYPWVGVMGLKAWGVRGRNSHQFRSHKETKTAARRIQRSASTISRKNRGL